MNNRSLRILEIIWLITGILCIAAAIRLMVQSGFSGRILIFAVMGAVSFLFALYRRRQRKNTTR